MFKKILSVLAAVWIVKGFAAIDDMVTFLNELPPDVAAQSKTLTLGPNRLLLGVATNPYYLIFKTDHPEQYSEENNPKRRRNIGE